MQQSIPFLYRYFAEKTEAPVALTTRRPRICPWGGSGGEAAPGLRHSRHSGPGGRDGDPLMRPLKVLFLSAEVAPFAKAGGLGDVCGSLPKALAALGHEVRVVMPAYASVEEAAPNRKARRPSQPSDAARADGRRRSAGGRPGGDAARQRRAGLLHRGTAAVRRSAVLLRLPGRRLPLRLLQPGGPRSGGRRPRLAARRGPRPRLAHRPGRHLAGHRRPDRRPLRRPADRLHHPQPDAPGHGPLERLQLPRPPDARPRRGAATAR